MILNKAPEESLDYHGYPTDEALSFISDANITTSAEAEEMFNYIASIWWMPNWGWRHSIEPDDYYPEKKVNRYKISTGGWSGNESIVECMKKNLYLQAFCWVESRRGGHYIYETRIEGDGTKKEE